MRRFLELGLTALAGASIAVGAVYGYTRMVGDRHEWLTNAYDYPQPFALLNVMHQLQRYADKMYFAGAARNQELAGWYAWKLRHAAAAIRHGQTEPYGRDGWDAQQLVEMLDTPLDAIDAAVEKRDWAAYDAAYVSLVDTCNACHVAADHAYVRIKVPDSGPIYSNQDYGVAPARP